MAAAFVPNAVASNPRYHSFQLFQRANRDEMDYSIFLDDGDFLARFQL